MAGRRSTVSLFLFGGFNGNGQRAYLGAFVGLSDHAASVLGLGNIGVLAPQIEYSAALQRPRNKNWRQKLDRMVLQKTLYMRRGCFRMRDRSHMASPF